jgi:tetratricopeptide (TPR) repeat protein
VAPNSADAAKLFEDALQAYDRGELEVAIAKLQAAYVAAPSAPVLYNLAQFQEAAGHRAAALTSFELYLSFAGAALPAGREQAVRAKLVELAKGLSRLKIRTEPANAVLSLDGASVPDSLTIDPGVHELIVGAPGFLPLRLEVNAEVGGSLQVVATLVPEPEAPTAPPQHVPATTDRAPAIPLKTIERHPVSAEAVPNANARRWSRTWATVLVGAGAALVGGAVVTYVVANDQSGTWDAESRRLDGIDPARRNDAYWRARADNNERSRTVRRLQGLELGLLIGAGVVSAAGVGVWFTSPSDPARIAAGIGYSGNW